jgi:hypothetical protein
MNALFRNSQVRRFTEADIPWGLEIAQERYHGRNAELGVQFVRWCMGNPNSIVLRGSAVFGVASVSMKYGFEKRARLDILAGRRGHRAVVEALQIVRAMVRWAALNGAEGYFRIDADTGVDFGPIARRLGGHEVDPERYPRYDIPLDGGTL